MNTISPDYPAWGQPMHPQISTFDHEFMDFAAIESAQLDGSDADRAWLAFVKRAEKLLGHSLDGDDYAEVIAAGRSDGYSLDGAYDAWLAGGTPDTYVAAVRTNPAYRNNGGLRWADEVTP